MKTDDAFTLGAYLRDRWLSILVIIFGLASLWIILLSFGVDLSNAIFIMIFVTVFVFLAYLGEFLRRRTYWQRLRTSSEIAASVDEMTSFMDSSSFLESTLTTEALERLQVLANNELAYAKQDASDYRSFIELWIHETKTPIATARLIAQRLDGPDAIGISRELEQIDREVEKALYLARSSSVANDYEIVEVSLKEACHEACMRNARFLIEQQCIPQIDIPEGLCVLSDKPWLTFMLGQVVVNAAQYGAKSIAFQAKVIDEGTPSGHTILDVIDDGQGIAESDMPRIFDKGFTGKNGRARGNATGMGLYLLASMSESLGIGLSITSEEGKGCTVQLVFPHDRSSSLVALKAK